MSFDPDAFLAQGKSNAFDPDAFLASPPPKKQMEEPTWAERNIAPLLEKTGLGNFMGGNVRGSAVGRVAMGAADPGLALFQLGSNMIGQGDAVNQGIRNTEANYQQARGQSAGTFDPLRMAGNIAITAPLATLGGAVTVGKGVAQGAGFAALNPINEGDNFFVDKAKQVGAGAVIGGVAAPVVGALSRVIQPKVNPNVAALQAEGIRPTVGQTAGGFLNSMEEKMQSLPLMGDAIRMARARSAADLEGAALNRSVAPIGSTITSRGGDAILEAKNKLGASYDDVIPKLSVNALDPVFVDKLANLRSMAQSLPAEEARQFDNLIAREFDGRLSPNGMLSGQNLKDTWRTLREQGDKFSKSDDPYKSQLGAAYKQILQELKDQVSATNPPELVAQLKNTDLGYANYKILQRAASNVNAVDGNFTPSMLQSAVRASDRSIGKGRMAEGNALMQDLSNAGKDVLTNKVNDSGTAGRMFLGAGALASGAINPAIPAALIGGAAMYTPQVQNALVALMTKRPDMAPQISNWLRLNSGLGTAGAVSAYNNE